jgi:hypothetical protein
MKWGSTGGSLRSSAGAHPGTTVWVSHNMIATGCTSSFELSQKCTRSDNAIFLATELPFSFSLATAASFQSNACEWLTFRNFLCKQCTHDVSAGDRLPVLHTLWKWGWFYLGFCGYSNLIQNYSTTQWTS